MSTAKISIPTRLISPSLKRSIPTVAHMGAKGIQIDVVNEVQDISSQTALKHLQQLLRQFDLSIASTSLGLTRPLTDEETLDSQISKIKDAITFTASLKADVLSTHIGPLPQKDSIEYSILVEVINDLARYANHSGVTLAITPMNESPVQFQELINKINQGHIALNYDPAAVYTSGYSPMDEYQSVYQSVSLVTVRDSMRQLDGAGIEVPFGEGDVNWDEMFALLHEGRYRGWLTIVRTQGNSIQADMEKAVQLVNLKTLNYWQ